MNRPVGNLYRGLTAGIVALPPPRAFGVASGPGAAAGLYAVLCVGFFAALTGGAPAQISGPTGPMIVVIAGIASRFVALDPVHGPAMAFTVVTLGGLIQIAFGALGGTDPQRLGNGGGPVGLPAATAATRGDIPRTCGGVAVRGPRRRPGRGAGRTAE